MGLVGRGGGFGEGVSREGAKTRRACWERVVSLGQEAEGLVDHGFHGWARMVSEVGGSGDLRFEI